MKVSFSTLIRFLVVLVSLGVFSAQPAIADSDSLVVPKEHFKSKCQRVAPGSDVVAVCDTSGWGGLGGACITLNADGGYLFDFGCDSYGGANDYLDTVCKPIPSHTNLIAVCGELPELDVRQTCITGDAEGNVYFELNCEHVTGPE